MLALAALVPGCGGSSERPGADAPAVSVQKALERDAEGPLLVTGALVVRGDEARLCSALAESYPPQCGEPSVRVENLDLGAIDAPLTTAEGVTWSEQPVALLGKVENGVLRAARE